MFKNGLYENKVGTNYSEKNFQEQNNVFSSYQLSIGPLSQKIFLSGVE